MKIFASSFALVPRVTFATFATFGSLAGCSAVATSVNDTTASQNVQVTGALRLEVSDFIAPGGFLWALPSITPQIGAIVVEQTQYGSLCSTNVSGDAQVQPSRITLTLRFSETLRSCGAQIRALTCTATVTAPAGGYSVIVLRAQAGQTDTLRTGNVVVR
jgi:hypothetical protein